MWSHYLTTLYRSLTRHRLYAALNVLGLAIGIAVFLVLWLDVRFETSFEKWIPDANQIYVVKARSIGNLAGLGETNHSMGGLLEELRADYPQLVGTRINDDRATVNWDGHVTAEAIQEVDPSFFAVFDLPLLYGDRSTMLSQPEGLVLTKTEAQRYFGTENAVGRTMTLVVQGKAALRRVTGVLADPPKSSDLVLSILIPLTPRFIATDPYWRHWGSFSVSTFLRLRGSAEASALDADLDRFTDRHGVSDLGEHPSRLLQLRTRPLLSMHLEKPRDRAVVTGLLAVGLLTLLLAALNYVNLATARAALRAREVAVRKVMGATEGALVIQFMAEAVLSAFIAALIGLSLTELTLPLVNAAGGTSLALDYFGPGGGILIVVLLALAIGLGAGAYPALVLSRFRPAAVLASARTPGGGRMGSRVRTALVMVQSAIAIAFTVSTCVILAETHYLRTADLGFARQGLISVTSFDDSAVNAAERQSLLAAWKASALITNVTAGDIAPGNEDNTNTNNTRQPSQPTPGPAINYVETKADFFSTYGAHLIAGRVLDLQHGADLSPTNEARVGRRSVVLNARAVKVLGFASPEAAIGKPLAGGNGDHEVVGVVDDFRLRSPHDPVPPTVYELNQKDFDGQVAAIRFQNADANAAIDELRRTWSQIVPDVPFRAVTAQDSLQTYYRPSDQNARLFTLGAVLAVGIGCLGLYGLASFTTARRVKEIGIRKTLGASTGDVLRLLLSQLLGPVLLASFLAWPLAFVAMRNWLSGFDQRIGLSPLYFLAASALMLAIALLTVLGQALTVARAEPARALRHE